MDKHDGNEEGARNKGRGMGWNHSLERVKAVLMVVYLV